MYVCAHKRFCRCRLFRSVNDSSRILKLKERKTKKKKKVINIKYTKNILMI